jgi:hypothetical protein
MKLSQIPILRETITVREDVTFDVRGINLSDLMTLVQAYAPVAAILWRKLQEDDKDLMSEDVRAMFQQVAYQFPDLVAAVIAMASDDYTPEGRRVARQLTADVQALAIETIFRLSFQSDSTLEKMASLAAKAIQGVTRAMEIAQLPLENGSGGSVAA